MPFSDQSIKQAVVDQLVWDSSVDASRVSVEVAEGQVTLRGKVPSYFARTQATQDARSVHGVLTVFNDTEIDARITTPTDRVIHDNVMQLLALHSAVDVGAPDVEVRGGEVTLRGAVDAYWKREFVEDRIAELAGVVSIDNQLAVVPSRHYADDDIAADVREALRRTHMQDADEIRVEVQNGIATLSGAVPSWFVWKTAHNTAAFTPGVVEVHNALQVMPPVAPPA